MEIVDALVTTLKLDASEFTQGSDKVDASLAKTRENAASTAKEMQARGAQAAEFFSRIRNEAVGLLGVLVGGRGIAAIVSDTVTGLASLGRAAHDIGIGASQLALLRNMIEASGGSADAATASFQNLAQAMARAQVFGPSPELATFLGRIGASPTDPVDVVYSKFNAWAQGRKPEDVITLGGMGGLDIGTIREAEKPRAQFLADMEAARKRGLPTDAMTEDMQKLQTAFREAQQAADNLINKGLDKLAPALTHLLNVITDFIEKHPDAATAIGLGATAAGGGILAWLVRTLFGKGGAAAGEAGVVGAAEAGTFTTMAAAALAAITTYLGFHIGGLNQGEQIPGGRKGQPMAPTPDVTGRDRQAYDYFRSIGFDDVHAAAAVGGIKGESGFDETQIGDNGQAVGLGQWHPDRVAKILAGTGIDVRTASFERQLQAMAWELTHTEGDAGKKFFAETGIFGASRSLVQDYERSKNQAWDTTTRAFYAEHYRSRFGGPIKPSAGNAAGSEPISSLDWVNHLHALGRGGAASSAHAETHIGQVNITTQATDAKGIAGTIAPALRDEGLYVVQANTGVF